MGENKTGNFMTKKAMRVMNFADRAVYFKLGMIKLLFSGQKIFLDNPMRISTPNGKYVMPCNYSMAGILNEIHVKGIYDKVKPNKNDIILDIGMNVGVYTVYASKKFGAKVIGIEPIKENYDFAVENNKLNKLNNILLHKAVSSQKGTIKIWIDKLSVGGHSSDKTWHSKNDVYEEVETISLNTLIEKYHPTYIKCDIEGGEWDIMLNADEETLKNIKKHVRFVVMELHDNKKDKFEDMEKLFQKLGYRTSLETIKDCGFLNAEILDE